jgi:hypothetical protein
MDEQTPVGAVVGRQGQRWQARTDQVCRDIVVARNRKIFPWANFDHEASPPSTRATRNDQLANIRLIYPAEKEVLGIIAIEQEAVPSH